MRHPKALAWEAKLKTLFDAIDERMEARHGRRFRRHPARPPHGGTASREQDGLFNVGASFTAGYGSRHGAGYLVEVQVRSLDPVPPEDQRAFEDEVAALLRKRLPHVFPGRTLTVERDGKRYKIFGDLKLGRL